MARLLASGKYLEVDSTPVTAAPFTAIIWANPADVTNLYYALFIGDKDVPDQRFHVQARCHVANDPLGIGPYDGASGLATVDGIQANVWQMFGGVFVSTTSRTAWLNTTGGSVNTTSSNPSGADRISVGRFGDSTPSGSWEGGLAHLAIWDVALSDSEMLSLANGISPLRIRRGNLVAYWPLNGQSPEVDIVGGLNLTINGTPPYVEEPPI